MKIQKLAEALNKAQAVMSGAKKDKKNPFFKSNYADLASVMEAVREPLAQNGLSISQTMDVMENGRMVLKTILMHNSGDFLESKMILPDITDPQKIGSCISYYRRYMLMAIVSLPAEDDDGNGAASAHQRKANYISKMQVDEIKAMIGDRKDVMEKMLAQCNGDIACIKVEQYPSAIMWLERILDGEDDGV